MRLSNANLRGMVLRVNAKSAMRTISVNYVVRLDSYDTEHGHAMPDTWQAVPWKTRGGYGSQSDGRGRANAGREVLWFSPHCLRPERRVLTLFDMD